VAARLLAEAEKEDQISTKPSKKQATPADSQLTAGEVSSAKRSRGRKDKAVGEEANAGNSPLLVHPEPGTKLEEPPKPASKKRATKAEKATTESGNPKLKPKPKSSKRATKATTELLWDLTEPTGDLPEAVLSAHGSLSTRSDAEMTINEQMENALDEWKIPDTDLHKHVFRNMKRFPDCIVLTRVGKFYEVSDPPIKSAGHD